MGDKKDSDKRNEDSRRDRSRAGHDARDDAEKDPDVNFKRDGENKGPLFKKK